jgi:hypothetical protein
VLAVALCLVMLLVLLPWGAEAGAYNPPLGEDARLDQIDDYPGGCLFECDQMVGLIDGLVDSVLTFIHPSKHDAAI